MAKALRGKQTRHTFRRSIRKTVGYRYLLYLPDAYSDDARVPLVLFLHGAGERGASLEAVKRHGPPKLVAEGGSFPFILVSPQCPDGAWWDAETLDALLDEVTETLAVDASRIYVTGLSMGGFGTWSLGILRPDRFAALAPVCGGGEDREAARLKKVPVWAFHGARDPVVPLARSQQMVNALKRAGGNVRLTIYPEAGHDSWTETYENPELYRWLLQHKRGE